MAIFYFLCFVKFSKDTFLWEKSCLERWKKNYRKMCVMVNETFLWEVSWNMENYYRNLWQMRMRNYGRINWKDYGKK